MLDFFNRNQSQLDCRLSVCHINHNYHAKSLKMSQIVSEYCNKNNLFNDKNSRLPGFLAERYTSYWFSENVNTKYLSFARLGQFLLSNNINKFVNPIKIPFTFRMYPTLHDY